MNSLPGPQHFIPCARCGAPLEVHAGYPTATCRCGNVTAVSQPYAHPSQGYPAPPPGMPMMMYPAAPYYGAPGGPPAKCSRGTYIVLGLFLGALGIHNFVAGRAGVGVAQLLITMLTGWLFFPLVAVGLWVLIEICTVTTDGNGARMT